MENNLWLHMAFCVVMAHGILSRSSAFPQVVTHPTDTSASAPFSALFSCSVQAYGYLTVTWYKNKEKPVPKKAYSTLTPSVNVTTSILTIPNVTSEDIGTYYCVVRANMKAAQSPAANLILADPFPPPIVMTDPVVNLTVNNYNLSMKCLPDNSKFNYNWIKKNETLPSRAQGARTSRLTVVNLKPEDSGDYQCVMSNSTGTISSNFSTVHVTASSPIIIMQPSDEVAEMYSFITLLCKVQGYGHINVTWRRIGYPLPSTAFVNSVNFTNGVYSILKITDIVGYHDGIYCCVVNNVAGQTTSNYAKISVKVPCPEIIKPYKNITVPVNKTANLYCLASSCGGLKYDWTKNASNLSTSAVTSYVSKNFSYFHPIVFTYLLKIPNVQLSDEGWYCCLATNECGTTKKCVWLEVNSPPEITYISPNMTYLEGNKTRLVCNAINDADAVNEVQITWFYKNLTSIYPVVPDNNRVRIDNKNLSSRQLHSKLILDPINRTDEGEYICKARNHPQSSTESSTRVTIKRICPPLQDPMNGIIILQENKAFFVCFSGTIVMGNTTLTCIKGNWDSLPPTCKLQNS